MREQRERNIASVDKGISHLFESSCLWIEGDLGDARYGVYNHTAVNPFPGNSDCFELGLAILILCSLFEPLFVSNSEY